MSFWGKFQNDDFAGISFISWGVIYIYIYIYVINYIILYIWFENTPSHPPIFRENPDLGQKMQETRLPAVGCKRSPVVSDAPKNSMARLMVSPGTPNNRELANSWSRMVGIDVPMEHREKTIPEFMAMLRWKHGELWWTMAIFWWRKRWWTSIMACGKVWIVHLFHSIQLWKSMNVWKERWNYMEKSSNYRENPWTTEKNYETMEKSMKLWNHPWHYISLQGKSLVRLLCTSDVWAVMSICTITYVGWPSLSKLIFWAAIRILSLWCTVSFSWMKFKLLCSCFVQI